MNAITRLQNTAGQKIHETMYGAKFRFLDKDDHPCSHSEIGKALDLTTGGMTQVDVVTINVRTELFDGGPCPEENNYCGLKVYGREWGNWQIRHITTGQGGCVLILTCHASNT